MHVPASSFLDKYRCLAILLDITLPRDSREATRTILKALKLPETEWQIGRTKVFLRNTVFDPLEKKRKEVLTYQILIIQRYWKGFAARQSKHTIITLKTRTFHSSLRVSTDETRYNSATAGVARQKGKNNISQKA